MTRGKKWTAQKTYGMIQITVRKFRSFVLEIAPAILLELYTKLRPTVWNCKEIWSEKEQENKQLNLTSYVLQKLIT